MKLEMRFRGFDREVLYSPSHGRYNRRGKADVAQLVEQLIRNQQVSGSIPLVGSRQPAKSISHQSKI
jgi:hypothetical protein